MIDDSGPARLIHTGLVTLHNGQLIEPRYRNGLIERYVDGRWELLDGPENDDRRLRRTIIEALPNEALTDARIRSIARITKNLCITAPISKPQMMLGFVDCDLRLDRDGLTKERHSPNHDVRLRFPFRCPMFVLSDPEFPELGDAFDPEPIHPSPLLQLFMNRMWPSVGDRDQRWDAFWRFCGAILFECAPKYKRYLIATGLADSGKSQLIKMTEGVVRAADGTIAHVEMNQMENEYYRAVIASAHLNTVGDLDAADIKRSGRFKEIVAGDESSGRFAYGRPFIYIPTCAHLYSCNELPRSIDQSSGWWNRPIVLPFEDRIPVRQRIKGIMDEILHEAIPEIVKYMIGGAIRLVRQDDYIIPMSSIAAANEWREEDPVHQFVMECCAKIDEPETPLKAIYYFYKSYANANGYAPMSINTFGKRLKMLDIPSKKSSGMHYALAVIDQRIQGMIEALDRARMGEREVGRDASAGNLPPKSFRNPEN